MSTKFLFALNFLAGAMCAFSCYVNVRAHNYPVAAVMVLFVAMNAHFGYNNFKRIRSGR